MEQAPSRDPVGPARARKITAAIAVRSERLLELRREQCASQARVAEVAHVNLETVRRAERGKSSIRSITRIAIALGVPTAELVQTT